MYVCMYVSMYVCMYQALIQTDFHIGDRFWAHENRRPKKINTKFFHVQQKNLVSKFPLQNLNKTSLYVNDI